MPFPPLETHVMTELEPGIENPRRLALEHAADIRKAALAHAGASQEHVEDCCAGMIYVGTDYSDDVVMATQLGYRTAWLRQTTDHTIHQIGHGERAKEVKEWRDRGTADALLFGTHGILQLETTLDRLRMESELRPGWEM